MINNFDQISNNKLDIFNNALSSYVKTIDMSENGTINDKIIKDKIIKSVKSSDVKKYKDLVYREKNSPVFIRSTKGSKSLLHYAVTCKSSIDKVKTMISTILQSDVDINHLDENGNTPLMYLLCEAKENQGRYKDEYLKGIIGFLIERGSNLDLHDSEDNSVTSLIEMIMKQDAQRYIDDINKAKYELEEEAKRVFTECMKDEEQDSVIKEVSIYGSYAKIKLNSDNEGLKISEFLQSDFCKKNQISGFCTLHNNEKAGIYGLLSPDGVRHYTVEHGSYQMELNWYAEGKECTVTININSKGVELIEHNGVTSEQIRLNQDVRINGLSLYEAIGKGIRVENQIPESVKLNDGKNNFVPYKNTSSTLGSSTPVKKTEPSNKVEKSTREQPANSLEKNILQQSSTDNFPKANQVVLNDDYNASSKSNLEQNNLQQSSTCNVPKIQGDTSFNQNNFGATSTIFNQNYAPKMNDDHSVFSNSSSFFNSENKDNIYETKPGSKVRISLNDQVLTTPKENITLLEEELLQAQKIANDLRRINNYITIESDTQIKDLEERLEDKDEKIKELENKLKNTKKALSDQGEAINVLNNTIHESKVQKESLQQTGEEVSEFKNELRDMSSNVQFTNNANKELQKQLDKKENKLQKAQNNFIKLEGEYESIQNELAQVKEEMESLKKEYIDAREENTLIKRTVSNLEDENLSLRGEIEKLNVKPNKSNMSLADELKAEGYKQTISDLEREIKEMKQGFTTNTKKSIETQTEYNENSLKNFSVLKDQNYHLSEEIQKLNSSNQKEKKNLENKLNQKNEESKKLLDQLERLQNEKATVENVNTENQELLKKIKQLEKDKAQLLAQYQAKETDYEQTIQDLETQESFNKNDKFENEEDLINFNNEFSPMLSTKQKEEKKITNTIPNIMDIHVSPGLNYLIPSRNLSESKGVTVQQTNSQEMQTQTGMGDTQRKLEEQVKLSGINSPRTPDSAYDSDSSSSIDSQKSVRPEQLKAKLENEEDLINFNNESNPILSTKQKEEKKITNTIPNIMDTPVPRGLDYLAPNYNLSESEGVAVQKTNSQQIETQNGMEDTQQKLEEQANFSDTNSTRTLDSGYDSSSPIDSHKSVRPEQLISKLNDLQFIQAVENNRNISPTTIEKDEILAPLKELENRLKQENLGLKPTLQHPMVKQDIELENILNNIKDKNSSIYNFLKGQIKDLEGENSLHDKDNLLKAGTDNSVTDSLEVQLNSKENLSGINSPKTPDSAYDSGLFSPSPTGNHNSVQSEQLKVKLNDLQLNKEQIQNNSQLEDPSSQSNVQKLIHQFDQKQDAKISPDQLTTNLKEARSLLNTVDLQDVNIETKKSVHVYDRNRISQGNIGIAFSKKLKQSWTQNIKEQKESKSLSLS